MGKRGKERKRKRAGLSSEPGSTTEIDGDDPLGGLSEGDVATTIRTLETLGRDAAPPHLGADGRICAQMAA